jgi:predicted ribosome quality control (RQC) complex YloA/Tae2 family protein
MPFDALIMRAVERRWQADLMPATCIRIHCGRDRLLFFLKTPQLGAQNVLVALQPGMQRVHRTSLQAVPGKSFLPSWLAKIIPFTIQNVTVPPFERIMYWAIVSTDEWGQATPAQLIVELAGHLTNLILVDASGEVVDAWRKFPPGRPGRTIWPKLPYHPPAPPINPLSTHNPAHLPPLAKQWMKAGGTWEQLDRDWQSGFAQGVYRLSSRTVDEVWVYPIAGYAAQPQPDVERALDLVFEHRERVQQEEQLRAQLLAVVQSRIAHLSEKINGYHISQEEDPNTWKTMGDLWLSYQHQFSSDPTLTTLTVSDDDNHPVVLTRTAGQTPVDCARDAYRRYKKLKARQEALARLIPIIEGELTQLETLRDQARGQSHPLDWYRTQLSHTVRVSSERRAREPFRHFKSTHGLDIWVGRNREENARLTFRVARPDDIWLHTKQAPGSHVILSTGKSVPDHADLLDAAVLAVFFSQASASSQVPVDYTRKKFVRKQPHAAPGQVLYQREKTLYITPEPDRLRRLGAVSEKLLDD